MKLRMTKRTALLGLVAAALIISGVKATSADSAQSATGVSIPQAAQMDLQSGVNPLSPSMVTTSTTPYAPSGGNWQNIGGNWRWAANGTGLQIASTWAKINGHIYHFESTGWMNTSWYKEDGTWYYLQPSGGYAGALYTSGWLKLNGTWYYLDPSTGIMQTGRRAINGTTYVFNASGAMSTGWARLNDGWHYSSTSGAEAVGWAIVNGYWYYMDPSTGIMVANTSKNIGGKTYSFDASGVWRS